MHHKPTMRDVAAKAGVSVMTVSYALRGHPHTSKETTERIRKIAAEMGYRLHPLVSVLNREIRASRKIKAPPVIAYVSSYADASTWLKNPVQGQYFLGAQQRCEELGFRFSHYELSKYKMSGKRLSAAMRYADVCGLIIAPMPVPGMTIDIDWDDFPAVAFGYSMSEPLLHRITLNHWQAVQTTIRKLIELGYERIASGSAIAVSSRIGGVSVGAFEHYQRELPQKRRIPILMNRSATPEFMRKWLEKYRPDAFIDQAPFSYYRLIKSAGWRIPEDIAYTTMCWSQEESFCAGIHENSFQIGKAAVDVLVQQIQDNRKGVPDHPSFTLINGTWVDGPSAPCKRHMTAQAAPVPI